MDTALIIAFDLAIIVGVAFSGVFWYLASRGQMRRIGKSEILDSKDINRIVVTFNRAQVLNQRAAFATSATAMFASVRLCLDIVQLAK